MLEGVSLEKAVSTFTADSIGVGFVDIVEDNGGGTEAIPDAAGVGVMACVAPAAAAPLPSTVAVLGTVRLESVVAGVARTATLIGAEDWEGCV